MNLLIIGNTDSPDNMRMVEEAARRGHTARIAHMSTMRIHTSPSDEFIFLDDERLIFGRWDVVLYRGMHPDFISAYLALSRVFMRYGATIANPSLVDGPFIWNKLHQMLVCADAGVRVPATTYLTHDASLDDVAAWHTLPVVLKPIHGSHGTDVYRCDTMHDLIARARQFPWGTFIVQDYLEADVDYRVVVVDGRALGAVVKTPIDGEFRTNTRLGGQFALHAMSDEMRDVAETCAALLQLPIAGIDMRTHDGLLHVIEVNRNPGFVNFEAATGINVAAACIDYLENLMRI